jgi:hypothetical protein
MYAAVWEEGIGGNLFLFRDNTYMGIYGNAQEDQ